MMILPTLFTNDLKKMNLDLPTVVNQNLRGLSNYNETDNRMINSKILSDDKIKFHCITMLLYDVRINRTVFYVQKYSTISMFNEVTFWEVLLPLLALMGEVSLEMSPC